MRLVSWNSFAAVGPTLTEPTWQAWDPDVTCLAMGYPDALVLCRLQPSVSAFASLPLQVCQRCRQAAGQPAVSCSGSSGEAGPHDFLCINSLLPPVLSVHRLQHALLRRF